MSISLSSVACSSRCTPSNSLRNFSLDDAYSIFDLTLDISGDQLTKKIFVFWHPSLSVNG